MMTRFKSGRTGALALAVAGALLVAGAGAASAAAPPWGTDPDSIGGLAFYDASGNQIVGGTISPTAPFAAYAQSTVPGGAGHSKATLFGYLPINGVVPGSWSGEAISGSSTYPNASAPAALASSPLPLVSLTAADVGLDILAEDYPNTATSGDYVGLYQLRLRTAAPGQSSLGGYSAATIKVTGSTWTLVDPLPSATATTTTLTTTPASPQIAGTAVTLNAAVSPAAAGTVQFKDGATNIGSPATVTAGAASISTSSLTAGAHSLSAVFTPTNAALYNGSTGTASFTVTAAPATPTTTALSVVPGTAAAFTPVALHADVTKTSDSAVVSAGSVKFYDNGVTLLGTVPLTGTGATLSYGNFAEGTHAVTAQFVPADPATYNTSTSPAVAFIATTPATAPASLNVEVDVPAGALTITTPYSAVNPFDLGATTLDAAGTKLTASAPFGTVAHPEQGVTITDTRAGNQPWTASATVTDFSDGASHAINGQNLSFTGVTPKYLTGNALQAGSVVTANVPSTGLHAAAAAGSDGLKGGPHQFATAATGNGSAYVIGDLGLVAPTSTVAGTYTATLTFTIA